jgi:hypothetical protein
MREMPPADPFPVDALGVILGAAARAIHDRVQAPVAIGAQSVLAVAALAAQAHADIELPIGRSGRRRPLSCFFVTVAGTGERKSACDHDAAWPVERREAVLREGYEPKAFTHQNDRIAWEKARDVAVKAAKGDRGAIKAALDRIGPAPMAPLTPMLTCSEPTYEGLCKLLATGQPSLGIFAAEGGQFIGGHGMSDEAKLRTAAGLSDVWDGSPIRRVRSGDGATVLVGRRVSAHLMVQPGVADILLKDEVLADQGLLSRVLVTAPDSASGTRLWHEERPETELDLRRYGARILGILERPLPLKPETVNELQPRPLSLSSVARGLWIQFADHVEQAVAPNGALECVRGLANKLPEHAARLAGALAVISNADAGEIAASEMEAGIALAEHYAAEAMRLFGGAAISAELRLARRFLHWLHEGWDEEAISLPDAYQRGPNAVRDKATAKKLFEILVDHGWLEPIAGGAVVAGQQRRDAWRIVRG